MHGSVPKGGIGARLYPVMKKIICTVFGLLAGFGGIVAAQGQIGALPGRIWGQLEKYGTVASYLSPVSTNPNLVEGREFYSPQGVAVDASGATPILYVADSQNNRILGWKDATALQDPQSGKWGVKADIVIGQLDFYSTISYGPNGTRALTAFSSGLSGPSGIAVDAQGNLWVLDSGNNRVLRFPKPMANIGSPNPQRADLILGQRDMISASPNQGASAPSEYTLSCYVSGLGVMQGALLFDYKGNLLVSDPANNRILIFDHTVVAQAGDTGDPVSNIAAREAVGQPDFVTATANPGPSTGTAVYTNLTDKTKLRFPSAIALDSMNNLFVADAIARVLMYPRASQVRGGAASRILGIPAQQPSGQSALPNVNEYSFAAVVANNAFFGGPGALLIISDNLYVVDTYSHRILEFPPAAGWAAEATTAMSPKAVAVYGQASFNANLANGVANGVPSASSFLVPGALAYVNNELYVADSGNNRVLVFDGFAAATTLPPAVRVAGQTGFTYNAANLIEGREFSLGAISWTVGTATKRTSMAPVVALDKANAYVYVSDPGNHRVLAFSDYRKLDGTQIADFVIGQTDLSSSLVNSPSNSSTTPGNTGLNTPTGLAVDSAGNLWVADTGNGRVVRFPAPFANRGNEVANLVLGKADFESTLSESSSTSMSRPVSLAFTSAGDLWVADVAYNRVLRFPQANGLANGSAADLVLGQPDFVTTTAGTGIGDQAYSALAAPLSIATDTSDRLYVTDTAKPRIMVWLVSASDNPQSGELGNELGLLDNNYIPLSVTIHPDPDNQVILYADAAGRIVKMPDYVSMAFGQAIDTSAVIGSYGARSITIDPAGNIYASDSANRIAVHYDSAVVTNGANGFQIVAPLTLAAMQTPGVQPLVSAEVDVSGAPYPTALGGYSLLVNGVAAPIYAVTSDTVKFIVPNATPVNETVDFMIVNSTTGAVISYVRNPVYVVAPAFLQDHAITGGYAVKALNSDGSANSSTNPAKPGSTITMLLTGSGFVQGAPADGTAGATPVPIDPTKDKLVIATGYVTVNSATLDPNTPGVWRITATIPTTAAAGAVPIGLFYKGIIANRNPASTTPGNGAAYGSGIYVSHN